MEQVIPRHGVCEALNSDRGHFLGTVVQKVGDMLRIKWMPHTSWRPESSGQVERMNKTINYTEYGDKTALGKIALTRIKASPVRELRFPPFKLLYLPREFQKKAMFKWQIKCYKTMCLP